MVHLAEPLRIVKSEQKGDQMNPILLGAIGGGMAGLLAGLFTAAMMRANEKPEPKVDPGPGLLIYMPEHGRGKYFLFGEGINGNIAMVPPLRASDRRKHPAWIVGEILDLVTLHKIRPERIAGHGPNVPELIQVIRQQIVNMAVPSIPAPEPNVSRETISEGGA